MAAKKVTRTTAKKMKDKWRAKQWYTIHAPDLFDNKEIPSTPADDPSKLKDRIVEVTMQELTSDFAKSHIKLKFRINRIAGFDAYTSFIGHEFTSDYIRRLTRRRRTKIDGVFDVTTKDGYRIRVKPMAIAEHRIQSSQKAIIRHRMQNVLLDVAQTKRMGEFISIMINGDVSRDIFRACKPIYRLKRIDIRRSEILGQLSGHQAVEDEPEDIDAAPEDEATEPVDIDAIEPETEAIPETEEIPEVTEDTPEVTEEITEEAEDIPVEESEATEDSTPEIPETDSEPVEEVPEVSEEIPEPAPVSEEPEIEAVPETEEIPVEEITEEPSEEEPKMTGEEE